MKRFFLILTAVLAFSTISARCADSLYRFSLLTCTPGTSSSTIYGHSAIRVQDPVTGMDLVYNYGTYSFNEPNFLWKFLRGKLKYSLSVSRYHNFYNSYALRGRGIYEQDFILTEAQTAELNDFLADNYRPENRNYLYDFLEDNCATRIRDIFNRSQYGFDDMPTDRTWRDELHRMNSGAKWMSYGIDLILGSRCDRKITLAQEMFLPDRLSEHIASHHNINTGENLTTLPIEILKPADEEMSIFGKLALWANPIVIYSILLLIYIFTFLKVQKKEKFINIFSTIFYMLIGIGGLIIAFMWFGTDHVWTKMNWNILWMNPLFLVAAFMRKGRIRFYFTGVLTALAILAPFIMLLIPQYFPPANAILIALMCFILLSYQIMKKR